MSEIPKNWAMARIGDICQAFNGRAFKSTEWAKEGLPIIRIQNLKKDDAGFNFFQGTVDEKNMVRKGDLLFAWSGTPGTSFGAHIWNGKDAALNQHIFKIEFGRDFIDHVYFCHALNQNVARYVEQAQGGVGLAHITKTEFDDSLIPLPPLNEQKRIVAKIEELFSELDSGIQSLKTAREQLKVYRQAVLKHAFEGKLTVTWRKKNKEKLESTKQLLTSVKKNDKVFNSQETADLPPIPPEWLYTRLGNVGDLGRGKSKHRPRNDKRLFGGIYPFIQTGEVKAANRVVREYSHTYSEFGLAQSKLWPTGTLCITIAANIAETAFLGFDACFPDSVVGFAAQQDVILPEYVDFFIQSVRARIEAYAPATAQKNINLTTLENLVIPLCSIQEQKELVGQLESIFSVIENNDTEIEINLQKSEALRQSILKKVFSGQLVAQDSADEPASRLLERIRIEKATAKPTAKKPKEKRRAA